MCLPHVCTVSLGYYTRGGVTGYACVGQDIDYRLCVFGEIEIVNYSMGGVVLWDKNFFVLLICFVLGITITKSISDSRIREYSPNPF